MYEGKFVITDVHTSDAYHYMKDAIIGIKGKWREDQMEGCHDCMDGYWAGRVKLDEKILAEQGKVWKENVSFFGIKIEKI